MAVWQWDIWIIPKDKVLKHFSTIPQYVDLDWFESIKWWDEVSQKQLTIFFDSILPRQSSSIAQNAENWGSDEKTCIRLLSEDGKITDVFIRIDIRQSNESIIQSLVNFAKDNSFLFFTLETNRFLKPEISGFLENLNKSRAMLFATDPNQFFDDKNYLDKINKENLRKIDEES